MPLDFPANRFSTLLTNPRCFWDTPSLLVRRGTPSRLRGIGRMPLHPTIPIGQPIELVITPDESGYLLILVLDPLGFICLVPRHTGDLTYIGQHSVDVDHDPEKDVSYCFPQPFDRPIAPTEPAGDYTVVGVVSEAPVSEDLRRRLSNEGEPGASGRISWTTLDGLADEIGAWAPGSYELHARRFLVAPA